MFALKKAITEIESDGRRCDDHEGGGEEGRFCLPTVSLTPIVESCKARNILEQFDAYELPQIHASDLLNHSYCCVTCLVDIDD